MMCAGQKRKVGWVYAGSLTAIGRQCSSIFGSCSRIKNLYDISGSTPPFSRIRISGLRPSRLFVLGHGKKSSTFEGISAYSLNGRLVMERQHLSGLIFGIPKDPSTSSSLMEIYIVLAFPEMPQSRNSYLPTVSLLNFCKPFTLGQMLSLSYTGTGRIN